mgnify:FL=1
MNNLDKLNAEIEQLEREINNLRNESDCDVAHAIMEDVHDSEEFYTVMDSLIDNHDVDGPGQLPKIQNKKRGRGRPPVVEDKEFIMIWNAATEAGKNLQQVAVDLGIAPASASVRASLLRKKGNSLNQFRRGRRKKV